MSTAQRLLVISRRGAGEGPPGLRDPGVQRCHRTPFSTVPSQRVRVLLALLTAPGEPSSWRPPRGEEERGHRCPFSGARSSDPETPSELPARPCCTSARLSPEGCVCCREGERGQRAKGRGFGFRVHVAKWCPVIHGPAQRGVVARCFVAVADSCNQLLQGKEIILDNLGGSRLIN